MLLFISSICYFASIQYTEQVDKIKKNSFKSFSAVLFLHLLSQVSMVMYIFSQAW